MKTKLFYTLLLNLLCSIFSLQTNAQSVGDTFTATNGIEYKITTISARGTSKVSAIDYSGASTSVAIPLLVTYSGSNYNVTAIGDDAFKQTYNEGPLESITIGSAVTSIGNDAFRDNNFTSVTIPNSITSIGSWSFYGNDITSLTLGSAVTSIKNSAFRGNGITSLTIPDNVTSIEDYAFQYNGLTSVTIPNSVTSIGSEAFSSNDLTSVTIGSGVTSIGEGAFFYNDLTEVISLSENPATITDDVFDGGYTNLQMKNIELTIPEGSEQAYYDAGWTGFKTINDRFTVLSIIYEVTNTNSYEVSVVGSSSSAKTTLTIPSDVENPNNSEYNYTVTAIGEEAFYDFADITEVTSEDETPATLGNNAFLDNSTITLIIPEGTTQAYIDAGWTGFITSEKFTVGDTTYEITNTTPLEVSIIDYTGTSTDVIIDTSVNYENTTYTITAIGESAFNGINLTSVVFPNSLTSIGESAFRTNDLTSITIPSAVTYIGDKAFDYNKDITSVISESENPAILESNTFYNNSLITLTIPAGTTQVYTDARWWYFGSVVEDTTLNTTDVEILNTITINTNATTLSVVSNAINITKVEIYFITGAKVAFGINKIAIDHLNSGIYITKIYTNNGIVSKKFIKKYRGQ